MTTEIKTRKNLSNVQMASRTLLLTLATGLIVRLLWTDSNTDDPGVTTVELLDYSISDVGAEVYDPDHRKYEKD